jgi:aryl-alcohol dehydrogenase-like predicted oxidoreductase
MSSIRTRRLGGLGPEVSAIGMGCWAIGGPFWAGTQPLGWGEVDDKESIAAINRGLELGVRFFDTANVYGCGHSERIVGAALKGVRDRVVIATKFGNTFDEETRQKIGQDVSPGGIRTACEDSLRRLDTDYVDLYQFHLNDYEPAAAVGILETLEGLVAAGKIRFYAWSTDYVDRAKVFAAGKHNVAVQHELSVFYDAPDMLRFCETYGLASINRSPLAMGMLTGKFKEKSQLGTDDVRGVQPQWLRYFDQGHPKPEWLDRVAKVREILTEDGRTLTQGALCWIWGRSPATIPIPGFRTVKQVEENVGALEFGPLPEEALKRIAEALA